VRFLTYVGLTVMFLIDPPAFSREDNRKHPDNIRRHNIHMRQYSLNHQARRLSARLKNRLKSRLTIRLQSSLVAAVLLVLAQIVSAANPSCTMAADMAASVAASMAASVPMTEMHQPAPANTVMANHHANHKMAPANLELIPPHDHTQNTAQHDTQDTHGTCATACDCSLTCAGATALQPASLKILANTIATTVESVNRPRRLRGFSHRHFRPPTYS